MNLCFSALSNFWSIFVCLFLLEGGGGAIQIKFILHKFFFFKKLFKKIKFTEA